MKKVVGLVVGLAVCFSSSVFGDVKVVTTTSVAAPNTKVETLLARKGRIIINELYNIGEFYFGRGDKLQVMAVCVYEPNQESSKIKAMRIDLIDNHGERQSSYFDADELAGLTKACDYMMTTANTWRLQSRELNEASYTTRSDFKIGFFQKGVAQTAYITVGLGGANMNLRSIDDIKTIEDFTTKCVALLATK